MNYKGYEISTTYDHDYPAPNNWMVVIYDWSLRENWCLWVNYLPTKSEAVEAAKRWIDEQ
jgi:hypothetical protein